MEIITSAITPSDKTRQIYYKFTPIDNGDISTIYSELERNNFKIEKVEWFNYERYINDHFGTIDIRQFLLGENQESIPNIDTLDFAFKFNNEPYRIVFDFNDDTVMTSQYMSNTIDLAPFVQSIENRIIDSKKR